MNALLCEKNPWKPTTPHHCSECKNPRTPVPTRESPFCSVYITQTLHVCHMCLHWGGLRGQCRHIWHTWSVWVISISAVQIQSDEVQHFASDRRMNLLGGQCLGNLGLMFWHQVDQQTAGRSKSRSTHSGCAGALVFIKVHGATRRCTSVPIRAGAAERSSPLRWTGTPGLTRGDWEAFLRTGRSSLIFPDTPCMPYMPTLTPQTTPM